jgi:oligopeptidase B
VLVTTGLYDSLVPYWEPAKWVAKIREYKTNDTLTLLKIDMSAGHEGVSGRYEALKDEALAQAFLLFIDR